MIQNIILGAAILIGLYLASVVLIRSLFKKRPEKDNIKKMDPRFFGFEDDYEERLRGN